MRLERDKPESPFGEIISRYTLEDAIEDGTHVDCGTVLELGYRIVMTRGLLNTATTEQLGHIIVRTLNGLNWGPKTDMVVFETEPVVIHSEDEGRTLITYLEGLEKKVYAKNDAGIVTIMLAEEY